MALGIYYVGHFRRMDSYPAGNSTRGSCDPTASRQASVIDNIFD